MDRAEKVGLGAAAAGHIVLFGLLSVGFLATPNPSKLINQPLDVYITDEVGLVSQAPQVSQDPAQSKAPEQGEPEEAAAASPMEAAEPEPAPPAPAAKPQPAPAPKPAPATKPQPPKPAAAERPQPAKNTPPRPAAAAPKAQPATKQATGSAAGTRARGSLLGADFEKGLREPAKGKSPLPKAQVGARAMSSIAALIAKQVQPCYDLGGLSGTSAMNIVTVLSLKFRKDGSVAAVTVAEQQGVNGSNQQYAKQMAELSRRALLRCAPLKNLPQEYYEGGWQDFDMGFIPNQLR